MQVKMKRAVVAAGEPRQVGDVVELPDAEALATVQSGAAERVDASGADGTIKVRLTRPATINGQARQVGEEIDLPDAEALQLIQGGSAVRVTPVGTQAGGLPAGTQYAVDATAQQAEQRTTKGRQA